ncbi:MAG: Fe-S cluster assembly protein SufB [Candidatus Woesearchaeota archaeon]
MGEKRLDKEIEVKPEDLNIEYKYGFKDPEKFSFKTEKGLNEKIIKTISKIKKEPNWMLEIRLKAYQHFKERAMPKWGQDLSKINFDDIYYYGKPEGTQSNKWEDVPDYIKNTFDKLGIPEAEKKFLAGVGAQYESEVVYHNLRKELKRKGVIFLDMDGGLKKHPDLVKKWFGKVVPYSDNKFAALNTAVWSGGSFIYVPKNVKVDLPLQAYFRINAKNIGQFERTLIIADEGSYVHYIEGCFIKGTKILTKEGEKNIEEIKQNEYVLSHNLKEKKVYKTQKRKYTGYLYEIEYYGDTSRKIVATEEHPFYAVRKEKAEYKNKKFNPEWIEAEKLNKGDYLSIPIIRKIKDKKTIIYKIKLGKGKVYIDEKVKIKTDKDFFRLIGYYLSEGSIINEHYLSFTFNIKEKEYIKDVEILLEKYFNKKPVRMKPYKNGISIILCSTIAARIFEKEFSKGAENKKLPEWVKYASLEKQKELIKGIYRGDGSFLNKKYNFGKKTMFRINTISKELAYSIRDILLRLNIFASINLQKRKGKRKDMYCIYIRGENLKEFSNLVNINFKREQKIKSLTKITKKYAFVPIKKITKKYVENIDVYNFSVEKDESYFAENVAVHNCTAPVYTTDSLHSAVVEIIALPKSTVRYTTIQNWSSNVYNLVTKRAFAYEKARVEWVDGNLGCLSYDTIIYTNKGFKKIENINQGDYVFSIDKGFKIKLNKVINKKYSGKQEIFLLTTKNHRQVKATRNHPFLVLRKINSLNLIKWLPLSEIKKGDCVAISGELEDFGKKFKLEKIEKKRLKNIPYLPAETTPDFVWFLGFYLGDGYLDNNRVCIAISPKDKNYVKLTNYLISLKLKFEKKGNVVRINSLYLVELLKKIGFSGNAKTKILPEWVFMLPKEQKLKLIEGYIDADGHYRKNHKNISITSVNKQLLEQIKDLGITIGLNPTKISKWVRKEKKPLGNEKKEYSHYFLYFSENILKQNVYFSEVFKIEKLGIEKTYDLEIENSHNFLAQGIFVHNSKITMKYPAIYLLGEKAHGEVISVAFAGKNQIQDAGAKIVHLAKNTTSQITSKSVSKDGGKTVYRGLLRINDGCKNVKSRVNCDALILDDKSASDTIPYMEIKEKDVLVGHEASTGKVSEEQLFYLMSRGLSEEEALAMIVRGFMDSFVRELPMEYALELNRLIKLNMEGSVG